MTARSTIRCCPIVEAGKAVMIESDHQPDPLLTIKDYPGHTPGSIAINLKDGGRQACFSGDIMHHPIQVYHPDWSSQFCWDQAMSAQLAPPASGGLRREQRAALPGALSWRQRGLHQAAGRRVPHRMGSSHDGRIEHAVTCQGWAGRRFWAGILGGSDEGSGGRRRLDRQGRDRVGRRRGGRRHRQRPRRGDPAGARRHQGAGGRSRPQARRAHGRDDQGRGRPCRRPCRRHHQGSRVQAAGRCGGRPLGPARLPRQQCRHRQPRQRGRREARGISPGHAGQRRDDVPALQARHPGHDQDRQGRLDRQHLVDLGAAPARPHHLLDLEGRRDRPHPGDGGRSRQGSHPGQLHLPRADVHADGLCPRQRHERGRPRAARQGLGAEARGHRLGHRPCRALPDVGARPLHHRPGAGGRWRRHAAGTGTRFSRIIEETKTMARLPYLEARPGRARVPRHAEAQHQPAQADGQLARHGARPSTASATSSASRASSTRACASSPSCRSAGWSARSTSSPITSRSARNSASPTRTSRA